MAVRKGLGRGLDSMFPRYDQPEGNTGKSAGSKEKATVEKEKPERKESRTAGKKNKKDNTLQNTGSKASASDAEPVAAAAQADVPQAGPVMVKISKVEPNRDQPRKDFNEDALEELAESIKQVGIIQPIIVQKREDYYEIIAGERRWRAARMAGLKEVPVIIKELTNKEILELSLIENIQREDLNAIEEAKAYKRLLEEFDLKQDELAQRVSKSRTAITNSMRLLKLSDPVQEMLIADMISAGHARALIPLEDPEQQLIAANRVFDEKLSVRDTEKMVKSMLRPAAPKKEREKPDEALELIYHDMEDHLRAALGTKVTINYSSSQKGKLEIEYYSSEELERIYDLLRFGAGNV